MELIVLTVLRLLIPLTILRWPIFGVFASMYLDFIDFNYFDTQADQATQFYQNWDKIFDTYYLTIAFITSLSWKDKLLKKVSIATFSLRILGFVLYLFTGARAVLLFFPNIFENFFLFYVIFKKFAKDKPLFTASLVVNAVIMGSIILPKLAAEYYLHIANAPVIFGLDRTPLFNLLPIAPENLAVYFSYIGPTIIVLGWRIWLARKSAKTD